MMNLNWAEKYGVRLIFGKVPEVTLNDALENFTQAERLYANKSKGNLLHLAKVFSFNCDEHKYRVFFSFSGFLKSNYFSSLTKRWSCRILF
jgi:hypothetical protein